MRVTHHPATAVLVAAALSTPLRAGDLIFEQVGSPTATSQPSSDFVSSWESWDIEVADDFDIVGVVREVWAIGYAGPFPPTGAWVRFYKVAEGGGPGDLVREHFFASSDPLLLANDWIIHAVLPEPLEVEGGLFVSVQQKLNSSGSNPTVASYWTWNGTLNGYPNGEPSYIRNPGGGWTDVCTTWCETGADRIFRLYGELFEPPPPPPPPAVVTITPESVARSGRFIITGSNFTDSEDEHQLLLNGAPAPHATWSDGEIHGYVPGDTPLGSATVQIVTEGGVTASQTIEILPLEPGDERVRWRFQADGINLYQRAGVGADGTVHFTDSTGSLYAVGADGGLRWIFNMVGGGSDGPVVVGADGTIYATGNPLGPDVDLFAINPDGTLRWKFTDSGSQSIIAGPNIGPDGNIYAITDIGGLGAFSLTPEGALRWSNTGTPAIVENGQIGAEIVFGPSRPGGPVDRFYAAFDLFSLDDRLYAFTFDGAQAFSVVTGAIDDPAQTQAQAAVSPDGPIYVTDFGPGGGLGWRLKSFSPVDGAINWMVFDEGSNVIGTPEVGPDGVVYVVRNLGQLHALDPDGTQRWLQSDSQIYRAPVVRGDNAIMLIGGVPDYGMPGFMQARDPEDGSVLWQLDLPAENGGNIVPASRAMFAPDGRTAYFGASYLANEPVGQYSWFYAVEIEPSGDVNGDGVVNVDDIVEVIVAWGPCAGCPADLNGDGVVGVDDLVMVVTGWS